MDIINKIRGTNRSELRNRKKQYWNLIIDKSVNIDNVDRISNEMENDDNIKYPGLTVVLPFNKRYEHWKL